ncbi:MAG: hypothetical protein E7368_01970 [Clostridiales bacterium]|nr:hypothetical protein [Clostridiales bacterium]
MIRNFHVITKGIYDKEQTNERLHIDRFLVVRKNRRRFLLLDLLNKASETMIALKLQIEQFDGRGNSLGETEHEFKRLEVKTGKSILKKRIELFPTCMDFKINVLYARYGNYFYCYGEEGNYVTFEKSGFGKKLGKAEIQRRTGKTGQVQGKRRFTIPVFVSIFSAVVMLISAGVAMVHLFAFKENRTDFFLRNIEYEIIGDPNSQTAPVYVTGYVGAGGEDIVIPAKVENHPVAGIAEGAFQGNSIIKKVTIEDGVAVSKDAFRDCFRLETVELLGNNVVSDYAFADCMKLSNIYINDVKQVGLYAFRGAMEIDNLTIKSSKGDMPNIHYTAFHDCERFNSIHVDAFINYTAGYQLIPSARVIDSLHLKNFYYTGYMSDTSSLNVATIFGDYVDIRALEIDYMDEIPAGFAGGLESSLESVKVKNITEAIVGKNAFIDCSRLKAIDLGKQIKEIGNNAFARTALESFSSSALSSMGTGVFEACTQLQSVDLSACTTLTEIPMGVFAGCSTLQSVKLPNALKSVGVSAFEACESLKGITLPSALETIDSGAFSKCYNLRYISLPKSVKTLGESVFANCYRLYEIENLSSDVSVSYGEDENRNTLKIYTSQEEARLYKETANGCTIAEVGTLYYLIDFDGTQKEVVVPSGRPIIILPHTFYKEQTIEKITIPDNVGHLGTNVFAESAVKEVIFSAGYSGLYWTADTFKGMNNLEKLDFGQRNFAEIYNSTFENFFALKTVKISPNVERIGDRAFANCSQLESVVGCNELASVGTEAFVSCSSLKTVETGMSLQTIGNSAFCGCYSLTAVHFPYGLWSIGESAFEGCSVLTEANFPSTLSYIGRRAFANCSAMESVSLPYSLTGIGEEAFIDCNQLHEVYDYSPLTIQKDSVENGYVGYNALEIFTWEFEGLEKKTIGNFVFKYSSNGNWYLVGYTGADDKITLGTISDGNWSVGSYEVARYAFDNCGASTLVIGSGVTAIRTYAFSNMHNLNWLMFSNCDLDKIPAYAFGGCGNLYNVVIPTDLSRIEQNALSSDWVNVYYEGTSWQWSTNSSKYDLGWVSSVYYYDACAHHDNEWKYTNGSVDTSNKEYAQQVVITQATCSKDGSAIRICPDCGDSIPETLEHRGHWFEEWNGSKCSRCGYFSGCYMNRDTYSQTSGVIGIDNIGDKKFDIFNSGYNVISIRSNAKTTAVLKIKAKTAMKISFSAESYGTACSLNVTINGTSQVVKNSNRWFEYNLNPNAEIIITYTDSGSSGVSMASIYNMSISSLTDPSL